MGQENGEERFASAARFLPEGLRQKVSTLPGRTKEQVEEFRLRQGRPMFLTYSWGEETVAGTEVDRQDIEHVLATASGGSAHVILEQVKRGFASLPGGHRLGLCGTGVMAEGELTNLRDISSLCLRIAREHKGAAREIVPLVCGENGVKNTLILSPPGGGKTTLLRDLVRALSAGEGYAAQRIGVVDERGEIAGMCRGAATLDVGPRSDVLNRVWKSEGIEFLLRSMNPQVIALDEVTRERDLRAMEQAAGCGVSLLATAHAGEFRDLKRRKLYRALLESGIMERFVFIRRDGGKRRYEVLNEDGERLC